MIDNVAAMADFIRAYDEMRDLQKRFFSLKAGSRDRLAAVQAAKIAEHKADALRQRVVLAGDEPTTGQLL